MSCLPLLLREDIGSKEDVVGTGLRAGINRWDFCFFACRCCTVTVTLMGALGMIISKTLVNEKVIQPLITTSEDFWEMECSWSPLHDLSNLCSRFRRQLSEPCNSFPPLPAMPREGRPIYQRQMSEPNIPFPPQGFKQEYHDPVYEHNAMVGSAASQNFPPPLMIKQEPRDFAYDSGR